MESQIKENAKRLDELIVPMMQMIQRFSAQMCKHEDFTLAQHRALMMVYHAGSMTVKQFQENLSIAQSTASETVERLVQLGWLEKSKDPKDRRITVFSLTEKAVRLHKEKETIRIEIHEKLLEPLSDEEQKQFLDGFELLLTKHKERQMNSNGKGSHENRNE